jgi:hypothetical protein
VFALLTPQHTFSVYDQTKSSLKVSSDPGDQMSLWCRGLAETANK